MESGFPPDADTAKALIGALRTAFGADAAPDWLVDHAADTWVREQGGDPDKGLLILPPWDFGPPGPWTREASFGRPAAQNDMAIRWTLNTTLVSTTGWSCPRSSRTTAPAAGSGAAPSTPADTRPSGCRRATCAPEWAPGCGVRSPPGPHRAPRQHRQRARGRPHLLVEAVPVQPAPAGRDAGRERPRCVRAAQGRSSGLDVALGVDIDAVLAPQSITPCSPARSSTASRPSRCPRASS